MKIFAFLLAILIFASPAFAYTYPKEMDKPWDHSPITFSINRTFPPECDPTYVDDFFRAIDYWKNGGNGRLSFLPDFREVTEKADIPVRWVKTVQNVSEEVGGITRLLVIPNKKFVSAGIELACTGDFQMKDENVVKEFSHREMEVTSMHELGHALGLDHTDDPHDIMAPKQTIQIVPVGFETSSYEIDLNISSKRIMAEESVVLSGKAPPKTKLRFLEFYNKSQVLFENETIVSDVNGNFRNSAKFSSVGRYVVEIYSVLSPQVYASSIVLVEAGADVQVNSKITAEIYLNGTLYGTAPLKMENLKYGGYEIECRAVGYEDYKTYLTIGPGAGNGLKAEPSRDAVLCANEKIGDQKKERGFLEKLSEAISEFFRILFG